MLVTTFYDGQERELFDLFLAKNENATILSEVRLEGLEVIPFIKSSWHPQDDRYKTTQIFLEESEAPDDEEVTVCDWQFFIDKSISETNLKKLGDNETILFNEGNILAEDFKFPPAFDSFLKIIDNIKILNSFYFFHNNPKILLPNLYKGPKKDIIQFLSLINGLRSKFANVATPLEVILFNYVARKA